jgi:hypothetical protein
MRHAISTRVVTLAVCSAVMLFALTMMIATTTAVHAQAKPKAAPAASLQDLQARVADLERRLNNTQLVISAPTPGQEFSCGGSNQASDPNMFMVGLRDGTGCGVTNVNWYRNVKLVIPK